MARSKASKEAERKVHILFNELGNRVQFNIMELSKVINPVEALILAGGTDEAVRALMIANVAKYGTPSI